MLDSIIKEGLIYTPKFIGKTSDKNYGDLVSHEDYNELVNLNTNQGDYTSEVLRILFTEQDATKTYHVPYVDNLLITELEKVYADKSDLNDRINENASRLDSQAQTMSDIKTENENINSLIADLTSGTTAVPSASYANNIKGIEDAGPDMYYGTDTNSAAGFYQLPPAIFAEDASSGDVGVSAIYIAPRPKSIDETMLTDALIERINQVQGVTDYPFLNNKPKINNVELNGNVSLDSLDIISKSAHNSDIQAAKDYTDTKHNSALQEVQSLSDTISANYLQKTVANSAFATITALDTTNTNLTNLTNTVSSVNNIATSANNAANIATRTYFTTSGISPKDGDLYIQV